jgi:uncharacterized phage infection (PIP) family protein YhgE
MLANHLTNATATETIVIDDSATGSSNASARSSFVVTNNNVPSAKLATNAESGLAIDARAKVLSEQISLVHSRMASERAQLLQRKAELRRKLDEAARELALVNGRIAALDKDETEVSAIVERTTSSVAEHLAAKPRLPEPSFSTPSVSYPSNFRL